MSAESDELRSMVLNFRVSELQMLLGFAGRNKSGRKNELQQRALELLRVRSHPVHLKIRELYKSIQQSGALSTAGAVNQTASVQQKDLQAPPTLTANMPQQQQQQQQANIPRATVHPFNPAADSRLAPPRQTIYTQQNLYSYAQSQQYTTAKPIQPAFPIHPDVRFKRLPFFDILADLIKPSSLMPQNSQRMQEHSFFFHLTPQQATDIASNRDLRHDSKLEYLKQVQLRFCLLETSCEQDDFFPPSVIVKVNNKLCPLPNPIPTNKPGVDPKRPPRPVNITPMIKLNPNIANTIAVSWAAEYGRGYVMSVMLVHKLNSAELLQRLKQRGVKHSDYTRGLIKEKLSEDADCEIRTTSLRVSLMCPLGKMRMSTPCRATTCQHLQCFDASLFLQMNERKPTWNCPVCDKPALYDHLVIDGYFQDALASGNLPMDTNEIQLHSDGSWSTHVVLKKESKVSKTTDLDESVQIIDDDVIPVVPDEKEKVKEEGSTPTEKKNSTIVDLTLSDSEDDQPIKRKTPPKPDSTNAFNDSMSVISSTTTSQSSALSAAGSVSSSGYQSPSVITLDSPSPPTSPLQSCNQTPARPACMMEIVPTTQTNSFHNPQGSMATTTANIYNSISGSLPFLEVEDSNSANSYYPQF